MAKQTRAERRRERSRRELAGKGWTSIVVGLLLLVVLPGFMQGPIIGTLGPALRPAGWAALGFGAVLLGLHYLIARQTTPKQMERVEQPWPVVKAARPTPPPSVAARREPVFASASSYPMPSNTASAPPHKQQWSTTVLAAIEWRRFEALCEALYAQAGFTTRSQSHGADGGVDIWLKSKHSDVPRIVQCKHWKSKPVGVKEMREFFGVMASHQLKSGTFVTSSTFSAEATAFAKENGIHAQDGTALLQVINQRTPEQQAALRSGLRRRILAANLRELRHQDGRKELVQKRRQLLGLRQLPEVRGRTIPKSKSAVAV